MRRGGERRRRGLTLAELKWQEGTKGVGRLHGMEIDLGRGRGWGGAVEGEGKGKGH